ncbi:MAG TPA: anaerobic ribonucleoside-triphosphate reductase activating protein [Methanomassiliicoccales archaeon]|nr:anaerobic ribonucleoside-triphosphate reductase activating protein [Methanomassiliicoccales archaeon]
MRIVGLAKTSLLDWDGNVTAVLYLPGCNFRCPVCHNRELVLEPDRVDEVPWEEIEGFINENREFLDGVVVTGGEPTIHKDLPELLRKLKRLGVRVKLDTNGSRPDVIQALIEEGLVDFIAMDLKAPLDSKYDGVAGVEVDLSAIKRSIEIVMSTGIDYEFRTTVVPVLLKDADYERIAAYIGTSKRYALQHFRPKNTLDPNFSVLDPISEERMKAIAEKCKPYVRRVVIRGGI